MSKDPLKIIKAKPDSIAELTTLLAKLLPENIRTNRNINTLVYQARLYNWPSFKSEIKNLTTEKEWKDYLNNHRTKHGYSIGRNN